MMTSAQRVVVVGFRQMAECLACGTVVALDHDCNNPECECGVIACDACGTEVAARDAAGTTDDPTAHFCCACRAEDEAVAA